MRLITTVVALLLLLQHAQAQDKGNIELTIYNDDLAFVREVRTLELRAGENRIRVEDVPAQLDPTSVHLEPLEGGKASVIEQNFEYDLVSDAKILQKYIDRKISIVTKDGTLYDGYLLSGVKQTKSWQNVPDPTGRYTRRQVVNYSYGNLVLAKDREKGPITIVQLSDNIREISLPDLPGGLITKPALVWDIIAEKAGAQKYQLLYLTRGMDWRADYTVVVSQDDRKMDMGAWVTIDNRCGKTFRNAQVKLVAGEVAQQRGRQYGRQPVRRYVYGRGDTAPQAESERLFAYHIYRLKDRTDVKNNQTKQVELMRASDIPVEKIYVYDGAKFQRYFGYGMNDQRYGTECNKDVEVYFEFVNSTRNNLGMPLPRGKMRLYKRDEDDSLEFIGEDWLYHTAPNERARVRVGKAFDIVGERKQVDFRRPAPRVIEEAFEIAVRNHKDEDIEVRVVEHLYRYAQWEILQKSQDFTKTNSQTIEFRVEVPANGEKKVTYRVRYRW